MKRYKFLLILIIAIVTTSCDDWLEVSPLTSTKAEDLFESEDGFNKALMGVYINLGSKALYGQNLTMGVLDVLAQNYTTPVNEFNHPFEYYAKYDYSKSAVIDRFDNIWSEMYRQIVNCNGIIDKIDGKKGVFMNNQYQIIKSEALAIRAFLHFDLLRMFAPAVRTEADLDNKGIPYRLHVSSKVSSFKTTREVIQYAIKDLKEAKDSLKIYDPIVNRSAYGDELSVNLTKREKRFNYYAVTALLARIYLYVGLYDEAYENAIEVYESELFDLIDIDNYVPFYEKKNPNDDEKEKSNTFLQEHIFTLFVNDLHEKYVDDLFFKSPINKKLSFQTSTLEKIYGKDAGENDARFDYWFRQSEGFSILTKYEFENYVPILKYSEILLILAESAPTIAESELYFNKLKMARGMQEVSITDFDIDEKIETEYRRDFIGEGQMFFYYKRKNTKILPNNVDLSNLEFVYDFPLPLTEIEYNN